MVFPIIYTMLRALYDCCKASFLGNVYLPYQNRKYKKPTLKTSQIMEQDSFQSKDEIYERKLEKIIEMLKFCEEHVPYYQDLFQEKKINVSKIKDIETFVSEIPILTKKQVQQNFDKLKATTILYPPTISNATGGSTGIPTRFIQDSNYLLFRDADQIRHWQWCGWKPWEKRAYLWGSDSDLQKGVKSCL